MDETLMFELRLINFLVHVTFNLSAYRRGELASNQPTLLCQGKPTNVHLSTFKTWFHSVMSEIAKRIDEEITYSLPITFEPNRNTPPGNSELWIYYPDGHYERVDE